jgi:hypothetical protein
MFPGLIAFSGAAAQETPRPTFVFGFEGVPERITGAAGEVKTFETYVTLTTLDNTSPDGAQGWSVNLAVEGGDFKGISVKGLQVSTIFDHDEDSLTPPLDPYLLDLGRHDLILNMAMKQGDACAASAVALYIDNNGKMVLQPTGTQRIARLTVEASIPEEADCAVLSLQFDGCFKGDPRPLLDLVTFDKGSYPPRTENSEVLLCRTQFRRGDFNGDGAVDISDAIAGLGHLYLGSAASGCRSAADANDDGQFDITDPIVLLVDLFSPEADSLIPPPGPLDCGIGLRGDPLGCESYPACPGAAPRD